VWCLFSLEDAVLIGLRKSAWVPVENATYGAIKLALLVGLAVVGIRWGLLGSWVIAAAILVVVVNIVLFTRLLPERQRQAARLPSLAGMTRFTAGHHFVALVGGLPDTLVPILVVALVSEQANAYYYAAWTVSFSMRLVAMNIANVLTVEGAHEVDRARHHLRAGGELGLLIVVPMTLAALLLAPWITGLFGHGYVEAAPVLRLFALGLVPFAFTTMFVAAERVGERVAAPAIVMTVSTVVTIALDLVLVPLMGIDGAGLGWLLAQLVAAAVVGAIMLRRRASGREVVPMPVGTGSEAAAGAVGPASAVGAAASGPGAAAGSGASAGSAARAAGSGASAGSAAAPGSERSSAAGLPSRAPLAPSGTGPSRR
ncbi:MAG TPA: lipid II flippase MurJ, partial [Candidatus Limnocylindrales bacterium]